MNYKKHSIKTVNKIILFFVLLIIAGCSEEQKKDDFIARVNESYLTREEFNSLVDSTILSVEQEDQLIKEWIYQEVLFQTAAKEGITKRNDYLNILNNSAHELAAAMLIDDLASSEEVKYSDDDLIKYFGKNKDYFQTESNLYLLNKVAFNNEDKAIKFRLLALESDWQNAVSLFISDSSLIKNSISSLLDEQYIYPVQLSRIIKDFYPDEISIVFTEKPGYYSVVQLISKYSKESMPPFNLLKTKIEARFIAEQKNKIIDQYLKELYSQNEIEIKK